MFFVITVITVILLGTFITLRIMTLRNATVEPPKQEVKERRKKQAALLPIITTKVHLPSLVVTKDMLHTVLLHAVLYGTIPVTSLGKPHSVTLSLNYRANNTIKYRFLLRNGKFGKKLIMSGTITFQERSFTS